MKHITIAAVLLASAISAQATCYGSGAFRTCSDNSGNNYTVQQYGNTTVTQGTNANTGSNWNQTSNTYGNTTYHNGTSASGGTWNGTSTTYGNTTYHNGTDSRGRPYSSTTTNND